MQIFDQFTRMKTSPEEIKSQSEDELTPVFSWHSILSTALMMIFLRLDCIEEQGSDKNLGQVTDWNVNELITLIEIILEECTDDLEGVKTKKRYSKLTKHKFSVQQDFKKPRNS